MGTRRWVAQSREDWGDRGGWLRLSALLFSGVQCHPDENPRGSGSGGVESSPTLGLSRFTATGVCRRVPVGVDWSAQQFTCTAVEAVVGDLASDWPCSCVNVGDASVERAVHQDSASRSDTESAPTSGAPRLRMKPEMPVVP